MPPWSSMRVRLEADARVGRAALSRTAEGRECLTIILMTLRRIADHLTPPGHPERPERAETMTESSSGSAPAGAA